MSVRYRPRGFDLRPGSRVVYVFENEVTRRQRIPRKVSVGVLHGIHRDGRGNAQGRVTFDNAPLENGHPRVATIPVELLAPESSPQLSAPGCRMTTSAVVARSASPRSRTSVTTSGMPRWSATRTSRGGSTRTSGTGQELASETSRTGGRAGG